MEAKKAQKIVDVEYIEVDQKELDSLYFNGEKSITLFDEWFNLEPRVKPYYGTNKKHKPEIVIELKSPKRVISGGSVVVSNGSVFESMKEFKKAYQLLKQA